MTWHHRVITSWPSFLEIVEIAHEAQTRENKSVLFRGQSDMRWKLQASVQRCLPPGHNATQCLALEQLLLERFKDRLPKSAPDVSPPGDHDLFAWWAVMQHYGGPTRLIDWTTSLHVAAYFAARENFETNGAIWMLSPWILFEDAKLRADPELPLEDLAQQPDPPHLVVALPSHDATNRMSAQESHFTLGIHVGIDQADAIDDMFANPAFDAVEQFHWKLVLPAELKTEFLFQLADAGVSAETLFPGLDGLGQSLTELAKCAALRQQMR